MNPKGKLLHGPPASGALVGGGGVRRVSVIANQLTRPIDLQTKEKAERSDHSRRVECKRIGSVYTWSTSIAIWAGAESRVKPLSRSRRISNFLTLPGTARASLFDVTCRFARDLRCRPGQTTLAAEYLLQARYWSFAEGVEIDGVAPDVRMEYVKLSDDSARCMENREKLPR
jgi:hypothetical protein